LRALPGTSVTTVRCTLDGRKNSGRLSMVAAEVPSPSGQESRRRLVRRRRGRWLGGVCAGLAESFGMNPGWLRAAFVLGVLFHGASVGVYLLAWICTPLEPADDAAGEENKSELRGVLIGLVAIGALIFASVLGRGTWVGWTVVLAPFVIAFGCVALRRGSGLDRAAMLGAGLVLTGAIAVANYDLVLHDRVVRPIDSMDMIKLTNLTNAFSDVTIDVSDFPTTGYPVEARAIFGDVTVVLPKDARIKLDTTLVFSDVESSGREIGGTIPFGSAGTWEGPSGSDAIRVHVFSAFGSVKVVRAED
jgi:phage shock protein PspC (stress-responsive transcriptional regulator)